MIMTDLHFNNIDGEAYLRGHGGTSFYSQLMRTD